MTKNLALSIAQMKLDDPTEPHDIVLIVDETKFYYSKIHLAKQSDYFKSMFFGGFAEKDKKEITLYDPESPEEFETFLNVINAVDCLTDTNVKGILRLSDQWQAPIVRMRCLKFLIEDSKKPAKEKFDLALLYGSEGLVTKALSEITTIGMLHEIIPADRSNWDQSTTEKVFERQLKLTGYGRVYNYNQLYEMVLQREQEEISNRKREGVDEIPVAERHAIRLNRYRELLRQHYPQKQN
ncbi:unnamed protein product [Caenorhabditis brenneri]